MPFSQANRVITASETLLEAENSAYESQRKAHREPHLYHSPIYPPGTEYAVCLAQAQLMGAVVGVLNESLTESIKGFYKLRKAYLTLQGIIDAETKYVNDRSTSSIASSVTGSSANIGTSSRPSTSKTVTEKPRVSTDPRLSSSNLDTRMQKEAEKETVGTPKDEFVDADETHSDLPTPKEYLGHLAIPTTEGKEVDTSAKSPKPSSTTTPERAPSIISSVADDFEKLTLQKTVKDLADASVFGTHPVDTFIVSGSNFCFGVLMIMISLVPPAFSMLLKIVGFKGDRERGIQMLWQASNFDNINGAMAGLVLFGYYNGLNGFCDILPSRGEGSYPKERCKAMLTEMRVRYPKSHLWLIEEARMMASEKELEKAVEYQASCGTSPLQQLEALQWFERSLSTMSLHDYAACSEGFAKVRYVLAFSATNSILISPSA